MGLALEFFLGDADQIVSAVEAVDFDRLNDSAVVRQRADLSLHIAPKDLDLLSIAIGHATGFPPLALRPHLNVLVGERDRGVLAVEKDWARYVSAVRVEQIKEIARDWVEQMRRVHGDEVVLSDELVQAVHDLVAICKTAQTSSDQLLHVWIA